MAHQHVGLFDDLAALDALAAEQQVRGHGRFGDVADEQRVQRVEPGELLVQTGGGVETIDQPSGEIEPMGRFVAL